MGPALLPSKCIFNFHKILLRLTIRSSFSNYTNISVDTMDNIALHSTKAKSEQLENFKTKTTSVRFKGWSNDSKLSSVKPYKSQVYNLSQNDDKLPINISNLSSKQISNLISTALDLERIDEVDWLISKCESYKKLPSTDVLMDMLVYFSDKASLKRVTKLQMLCLALNSKLYKNNHGFDHYLAKTHCLKGNTDRGLKLFLEIYIDNHSLRQSIRNILRNVIEETVSNKSQASVVILRRFVEKLSEAFNDNCPLIHFWQCCWLSSMFSDQLLCEELISSHIFLQKLLETKAGPLCAMALRAAGPGAGEDAVLRLLQALLRLQTMDAYLSALEVLFDYRVRNDDHKGCTEILHNCEVLGLKLTSSRNEKYIKMVINKSTLTKLWPVKQKKPVSQFQLKF